MTPYAEQAEQARKQLKTFERLLPEVTSALSETVTDYIKALDTLARVEAVTKQDPEPYYLRYDRGFLQLKQAVLKALEGE